MDKSPNIVLIDIETSPLMGLSWSTYKTDILKIVEPSKVLSCAWKRLGEDKIYCKAICDYDDYVAGVVDDKRLVTDVWKVIDKADVIIGQNSDAFDLKKLNSRFVVHGLTAPSDFKSVDTLKEAKKHFRFDSNKLTDLASILGVGSKLPTGGFSLWIDCIAGDPAAWSRMKEYNSNDVVILEQVYYKLRPYMVHPNLGLITEAKEMVCSACLSHNLQKRGFTYTTAGRKQRYQCNECHSWSTGSWERRSLDVSEDEYDVG